MATKTEISAAIKAGNYKVKVYAPNNIEKKFHPDGSVFYVLYNLDGCRSSTDAGSCVVDICGVKFECDLNLGEWSCSESEFAEDRQIIDTLESRKDILWGEMLEPDQQVIVYERATGEHCDEYYWCEDDDVPVDADEIPGPYDLDFERAIINNTWVHISEETAGTENTYLGILDNELSDNYGCYQCVVVVCNHKHEPVYIETDCDMIYDSINDEFKKSPH